MAKGSDVVRTEPAMAAKLFGRLRGIGHGSGGKVSGWFLANLGPFEECLSDDVKERP